MKGVKAVAILILLGVVCQHVLAQSKVGTTAANFLLIGVGALMKVRK